MVVKLQAPALLALVVPSSAPAVLQTVTVEPSAAVPVSVTEPLEFAASLLMTGAAMLGLTVILSVTVSLLD